ncbi:T9SS type A sorting domain-containing protein [Chryseobacterium panacisoli]|uniref:T9SS type A sorting domain-containing protein n=1 Tax=Chryseobacterium panacisoli TaxID=1807141 RepID=A0A5D8ZJE0_9FLAO|nr:T9SS type A sorting domain-containing protein [Chryseobacterium panacisoli]TZF94253.1 T9SS type A sorting domain-containing protein [Chryseobacterium panacisoli]
MRKNRSIGKVFLLFLLMPFLAYSQCWKEISTGRWNSVGVKNDGTLWTWGNNWYGQLGDGTTVYKTSPVQIGNANWKSIITTPAEDYVLAIKSDDSLWGWGSNFHGLMGGPINENKTSPVEIGSAANIKIMSPGEHILTVRTDGTLWARGDNTFGQLGDGTITDQNFNYIQIGTGTNWKTVGVGVFHSIALKTDGTLWAWGFNSTGQLGDGTNVYKTSPVQIGIDTNWKSISAGPNYNLALKTDGTLWAWGYNVNGKVGDGTTIDKFVPTQIGTTSDWKSIAAGVNHSLAIKDNGTLWAWGDNSTGQLGDGTYLNKLVPTQIGAQNNWKTAVGGYNHTLALKTDGSLWSWGDNGSGQLGDGTNVEKIIPTAISCPTSLTLQVNENVIKNEGIVLYPNPAKTSFMIKNLSGIKMVKVYNEEGKLTGSYINTNIINIESLQQGIYWVKIEDLKGNTVIRKLIKTEEK